MNLNDNHPEDSIRRVAHNHTSGKHRGPALDLASFLALSKFRNKHGIPTHHDRILPKKYCKDLIHPRPFTDAEIKEDIEWYFAYGNLCDCFYNSDRHCALCIILQEMKEEHLQKQLATERYIKDMERQIGKWMSEEERRLRGGYVWQRAFHQAMRLCRGEKRVQPCNSRRLPPSLSKEHCSFQDPGMDEGKTSSETHLAKTDGRESQSTLQSGLASIHKATIRMIEDSDEEPDSEPHTLVSLG